MEERPTTSPLWISFVCGIVNAYNDEGVERTAAIASCLNIVLIVAYYLLGFCIGYIITLSRPTRWVVMQRRGMMFDVLLLVLESRAQKNVRLGTLSQVY